MDVVHSVIAVAKLHRLPHHGADHMRNVSAAFLVEHDRRLRRHVNPVAESVFDIHKYIREPPIVNDVLLRHIWRLRTFTTGGVLRHVDHNSGRRFAIEADGTGHRARGRRIDLRIGRRRPG